MAIKKGQTDGVTLSKTLSVDEFGIVTQTITESISSLGTTSANAYNSSDFNVIGSSSPDYSYLKCVGVNIQDDDYIKSITKTFQGVDTEKIYWRITAQGSQEPITTHPAFTELKDGLGPIGGTGDDPKNGAIFKGEEEDSEFDYFPANADNNLGGVSAYLEPTAEVEKITIKPNTSVTSPVWDNNAVFNIADIQNPQIPNLQIGQRTWLLMGSTQEVFGGCIKVTEIYRMSGPKGWNVLIYDQT